MKNMTSMLLELAIVTTFYIQEPICNAQFQFEDSGQRLGHAASLDVVLGDLDGDGDLDTVCANNFWNDQIPQQNAIWLNNGDATFTKSEQQLGASNNVALHDIDKDGDLDLFEIGDWQQEIIKTWLNNGLGHFSLSDKYVFSGIKLVFDSQISDRDHHVVTFSNAGGPEVKVYLLTEDNASLVTSIALNNTFQITAVVTGDLNMDGYSDIVVGQYNKTTILFNNKKGGFDISGDQQLEGSLCSELVLGDVNGDRSLDLLQMNYHTMDKPSRVKPAQLYINDGLGRMTSVPLPYNRSYLAPSAGFYDFDNDGDLDIFINHGHRYKFWDHQNEILINNGQADFTPQTIDLETCQANATVFGDLDNDGDLDAFLAVTEIIMGDAQYGGPNRVWLNTTRLSN